MLNLKWREHIKCTREEKLSCLPLIDEMVGIAERVRKDGILAFDKITDSIDNTLLRTGLELCVDGIGKDDVEYNLTEMIMMSEKTGVELVKMFITATGIIDMYKGDHPRHVRQHLTMLLGEDVYGEVMRAEGKKSNV